MAQHNPASRAFLLIVLAGIVIGFAIAFFFLKGDDGEKGAVSEHSEQPSAEPAGEQSPPAAEAPVEIPTEGMSDDMTPPDEMPLEGEGIDTDGMSDDMTPPDEMIDEPLPGEAPEALTPEPVPEPSASEPPAPNP